MNRQLEESLVIKKQVAREKMPVIESVETRLVKLNEKIEKLYAAEFARNVRVDDDLIAGLQSSKSLLSWLSRNGLSMTQSSL